MLPQCADEQRSLLFSNAHTLHSIGLAQRVEVAALMLATLGSAAVSMRVVGSSAL